MAKIGTRAIAFSSLRGANDDDRIAISLPMCPGTVGLLRDRL
jgi:hypothetical protein